MKEFLMDEEEGRTKVKYKNGGRKKGFLFFKKKSRKGEVTRGGRERVSESEKKEAKDKRHRASRKGV